MSYSIKDLKDLSDGFAAKLKEAGVATTEDLLEKAGSSAGRKQLAEQLGTQASQVLTWVNEADLMRIPGIAQGFSQLLEAAGVDTVKELATRNAENLTAKITEVNEQLKLTGRVPNQAVVEEWIAQAKSMVPKVTH
jgi:predicted flap endonuclease-1-like 5' DNA nuclease